LNPGYESKTKPPQRSQLPCPPKAPFVCQPANNCWLLALNLTVGETRTYIPGIYVHIGIDGHDKRALIRGRKCSNWSTRNARGPIVCSRAGNWRQHWSQHDPHQSQSAALHSEKYLDWKWIRLTRFCSGKIAGNVGRKDKNTYGYCFITNKFVNQC